MAVKLNGKPLIPAKPPKKKSTHTKARAYQGSLNEPGRFRVGNWLHLLNISASAFYARQRWPQFYKNPVPPLPDGHDPRPYWNTETVRRFIEESQ